MKALFTFLVLVVFAGCAPAPMSRQEVIKACSECRAAGMRASILRSGWTMEIARVECLPIEQ